MWKSLFTGIVLGIFFIVLAFLTNHPALISYITGGVGLIALLISGILSNGWSRKKTKLDYVNHTESKEERYKRTKGMYRLFLFSTPLLISTCVLYFI